MTATNEQLRTRHDRDAARPLARTLHPRVYVLLVGLSLWFVLAVWSFSGAGVTDYLLFIVSGFIFIVIALSFILSRVGRRDAVAADRAAPGDDEPQQSWHDWASLDFDTWAGRLSGMQAALQILLPVAAAAVGMTAIGIAFQIAEHLV